MKKLGIIVPIYNAESYLEKCIESILNQTYKNIEIMLVNDGSSDNSGYICEKYAKYDKRVHVRKQENMGPIMARYNGAVNLDCDYLTFVDADDWIEPCTYEKMSSYMDDNEDVIMFQIIRYYDENYQKYSPITFAPGIYNREAIERLILPNMIWNLEKSIFGIDPSLCNKIIKRNILVDNLNKVKKIDIHYGEDPAVTFPLFMGINSLVISDQYLYYHRHRKSGELAPYLKDKKYFEKLFVLYSYLKDILSEKDKLQKQLEYFYAYSVEMRLKVYGDQKSHIGYLFPFDIVPAKSKIILYGAGAIGQLFYQQIQRIEYCTVIVWVDKNYTSYQKLGVSSIDSVKCNKEYDYVVIAVERDDLVRQIILDLTFRGIDESKIVWLIR